MLINKTEFHDMMSQVGTQILLAVSGGADSMVMMHDVASLKTEYPDKVFMVAYIDHQLNPSSKQWGQLVIQMAEEYGFPATMISVDVSQFGRNLEFAARQARYKALTTLNPNAIIMGHHANDRIENFLMKLMRGSGVKGLRSIRPVSDCWINHNIKMLRPLLQITREAIEDYADRTGVAYINDPSNQDNKFDRNWIRNVAWPLIQNRYQIADVNVGRCLEFINEAYDLTQELAEIDYQNVKIKSNELDWQKMQIMSKSRLKNLIMYVLNNASDGGFSTQQVELFATCIKNADMDNTTELRTKTITLAKIGKRVVISNLKEVS